MAVRRSYVRTRDGGLVRSGKDLQQISRELRRMDNREVTKRFRRELRAAAQPLVPAARRAALDIPVNGTSGSTGLRKRLARSVRLIVRTTGRNAGVAILADPARMPAGQKALPAYMEGTKQPFRHPVFGRTDDPWEVQEAHPWFYPAMRSLGARGRIGVAAVINSISRDIT